MNDPCAPGFDSTTQTYHLFYQCKLFCGGFGNWRLTDVKGILCLVTGATLAGATTLVETEYIGSTMTMSQCSSQTQPTTKMVYSQGASIPQVFMESLGNLPCSTLR